MSSIPLPISKGAVLFLVCFALGLVLAGQDVRSSELVRDACTPPLLPVPSVVDAVDTFGLKKPSDSADLFPLISHLQL